MSIEGSIILYRCHGSERSDDDNYANATVVKQALPTPLSAMPIPPTKTQDHHDGQPYYKHF